VLAGRYRLDRLVGEGGSGAVWAAEHIVTGKRVALKILKPSADSPTWRGRFIREARAACAVRHPNVVTVHDVIEADDGSPVLVMDLLEGETLRARLTRERTLSLAAAIEIMLPVISAVETAHSSGVVHRDLKPENIFLGREAGAAGVRVVDFGIAKLTASEGIAPIETLTATGAVIGTIYYMAPEQVYGERDIDHRVDVWSIGVIFYECLAGRRPTEGENAGQVLKLITSGGIPPLHQAAPHVPADIADLVMQMLTREVGGRASCVRFARCSCGTREGGLFRRLRSARRPRAQAPRRALLLPRRRRRRPSRGSVSRRAGRHRSGGRTMRRARRSARGAGRRTWCRSSASLQ